jgi:hypothetical protein
VSPAAGPFAGRERPGRPRARGVRRSRRFHVLYDSGRSSTPGALAAGRRSRGRARRRSAHRPPLGCDRRPTQHPNRAAAAQVSHGGRSRRPADRRRPALPAAPRTTDGVALQVSRSSLGRCDVATENRDRRRLVVPNFLDRPDSIVPANGGSFGERFGELLRPGGAERGLGAHQYGVDVLVHRVEDMPCRGVVALPARPRLRPLGYRHDGAAPERRLASS